MDKLQNKTMFMVQPMGNVNIFHECMYLSVFGLHLNLEHERSPLSIGTFIVYKSRSSYPPSYLLNKENHMNFIYRKKNALTTKI